MARTTRTFVAVAVPGNRAGNGRLQSLLAPDVPGVRWVEPREFHMTLAFLGDVADTDLPAVCRAVAEASTGFEPFELRLEALGCFPNPACPRVLWVGLTGDTEVLSDLQAAVATAVDRAGYPADDRFHPHVTLGRLKPGKGPAVDVTPLLRHYRGWSAGSFPVAEVVTFASTLTPDGPAYAPLARAALDGGKLKASP